MRNQFYMILPSNSSMGVFTDNTTSFYTTLLPQEVNLKGNWEVGLSEIIFPTTFLHITSEDTEVIVEDILNGDVVSEVKVNIPYGIFDTAQEVMKILDRALMDKHIILKTSEDHNYSYIRAVRNCGPYKCEKTHRITMSRNVLDIPGYASVEKSFIVDKPQIATFPASITNFRPKQLYVYTDICKSYAVGDVQASLLRIVPVKTKDYIFGATQYRSFALINYIPLLKSNFRTVVIDIRDHLGRRCPFECGHSTTTLHFRRVDQK